MTRIRMKSLWLFSLILCYILIPRSRIVAKESAEKQINSGTCGSLTLEAIPVGDFVSPPILPETPYNINQWYNTPTEDGYWYDETWYYGHDGIDSEGSSDDAGVNDVVAIQKGMVILSERESDTAGWGESIIIATRPNSASEEIITVHYHHLHNSGESDNNYVTTRRFNACEIVDRKANIGKEGNTGHSNGAHLHLTTRRWKNIQELKNALTVKGKPLFGHGYTFGDDSRLQKHLDPHALLFNYYHDYQDPNLPYMWSQEYVLKMRKYGIEFGLWNGNYGAQEPSTRGEVARWLKVALGISSVKNVQNTFDDVSADDARFPYVEALTRFPTSVSQTDNAVVNSLHSCTDDGTKKFCPDDPVNRAEALKMMIVAFHYSEFDSFNRKFFWLTQASEVLNALSLFLNVPKTQLFQDVDVHEWYAPYVYFGVIKGFVELQPNFNPGQQVMREEMAKWVVKGYELLNTPVSSLCDSVTCPSGEHCNPSNGNCDVDSKCVPSETKECEVGGGLSDSCDNPQCTPTHTQTQPCGNGGQQISTCTDECEWGPWGSCEGGDSCQPNAQNPCGNCGTMTCGSNGQWGSCFNQGVCSPNTPQSQTCNDVGTQTKTCLNNCTWSGWGTCSAECTPGQPADTQPCTIGSQSGTQTRNCNLNGTWTSWGACVVSCQCSSGACCDGCNYYSASHTCDGYYTYQCEGSNPGQDAQKAAVNTKCSGYSEACDGEISQGNWLLKENCSSSQKCEMNGGVSECVPVTTCQDTYIANGSNACYKSSGTQYGYTACLQVQQVSGSSWKYRICKDSGTFPYGIKYQLFDENHLSQSLGGQYQEGGGNACTNWRNFNVNHITQYGSSNGAGLRGEIITPPSCTLNSCKYKTGSITIRKECQ